MKSFIIVIICICLLLLASFSLGGERIYDFSNDEAWEPITANCTWEIIDGEYVRTDTDTGTAGIAVLKESEGIDTLDVESVEVRTLDLGSGSWQNMTIVFSFDDGAPLSYQAGPFVGGAQAWRMQTFNSADQGGVATVHSFTDVLAPNVWYNVKLVFEGDTVIMYGAEEGNDLEEKLRYDIPGGLLPGRIGLGGNGSNVKYDDLTITGAGIKGMAVEPGNNLSATWGKIKMESGL